MSILDVFRTHPLKAAAKRGFADPAVAALERPDFLPFLVVLSADGSVERFALHAPTSEEGQDMGYEMIHEMAATSLQRIERYAFVYPGHYFFSAPRRVTARMFPVVCECGFGDGSQAAYYVTSMRRFADGKLRKNPLCRKYGDAVSAASTRRTFAKRQAVPGAMGQVMYQMVRLPLVGLGVTVLEAGGTLEEIPEAVWNDLEQLIDTWNNSDSKQVRLLASAASGHPVDRWSVLEAREQSLRLDVLKSCLHISHQLMIEASRVDEMEPEDVQQVLADVAAFGRRVAVATLQGAPAPEGLGRLLGYMEGIAAQPYDFAVE